ncbi:10256_t:CDS:1 [Funneliformis caledonium]|uniref:10256_t:CDS:1 n=1 Tax=Funneliformis caledonium TaxID=1117310 RepID=A0A9N9I7H3_9GLOM|nr:10256_t:CDS:1 [Funneliformis caledonium]
MPINYICESCGSSCQQCCGNRNKTLIIKDYDYCQENPASKYEVYLERMVGELEKKREEIDSLSKPEQQLDRMRQYYSKSERLNNYFSKYRDKGSGSENYHNFLRAKGKYLLRYDPWAKEAKVIASFERTLINGS